jgi:hypothetical protein
MKHWIIISIIIAIAILGIGLMDYSFKTRKFNQEQLAEEYKAQELQLCKNEAWSSYSEEWNGSCQIFYGLDSCNLPAFRSDELEASRNKRIELCIDQYK